MTDGPEKTKVIEAPTRRSQRYEPPRARASPRVPHANEEPGASSGTTVAARKLAVVLGLPGMAGTGTAVAIDGWNVA